MRKDNKKHFDVYWSLARPKPFSEEPLFCSFGRHLRDSYLSLKMTLEKLLINGCKLIFGFKETIKNTISNKLDFRILSMTKLRQ